MDQLCSNCTADQHLFFVTGIVQTFFFLFQAAKYLLWLYSLVCVQPGLKPTLLVYNAKAYVMFLLFPQEKQKLSRELEHNQDGIRDTRSKVANLTSERDRLFQEKLEFNNKIQQLLLDKEATEKVGYINIFEPRLERTNHVVFEQARYRRSYTSTKGG